MSPAIPLPDSSPRTEKPARILWAAATLFGRKGVAHTSTREIAALAETTERTLFKHFGSKDALISAVLAEAVVVHLAGDSLDELAALLSAEVHDLEQWHQDILKRRSQALALAPELARLLAVELLRDEALRQQFASMWIRSAWEPACAAFTRLQQERRVRGDLDPTAIAKHFLTVNLGYLVGRLLQEEAMVDDPKGRSEVAALFAASIRA
jgi:AcrR family transcriptional regulator